MSIVVGIDPSLTSAGVAVLVDGQPVHVSHHGFEFTDTKRNPPTWARRSDRVTYVNAQIAAAIPPGVDLAIIEEIPAHGRILPSLLDRMSLWGGVYAHLRRKLKVPIVVINPMTLKVWATGSGKSDNKAGVIAAVESWWPQQKFAVNDECDAAVLAAIGAFYVGDPMPFEIKDRHTTALEKVAWPDGLAPGAVPELGQMTL